MSKRKDAVALFDLINRGKSREATPGLNVPGWFGKRPPSAPEGPEAPPAESPASAQPAPAPAFNPFAPAAPAEPLFQAGDGRLRVSLNYATCAVTAMGLLCALGFMFYLGRISIRPPRAAPAPHNGLGGQVQFRPGPGTVPADANAGAFTSTAGRTKGKYYLIIDRMNGLTDDDHKDAEAAADYCNRNGQPCTIMTSGGTRWALVSLKPFDSYRSQEALDYATAIEALGARYRAPAGRKTYHFIQKRDGKLDPSWHYEKP